ncbi:tetratricopeptide repeat-containing sensor histidine kinase [Mucilaginibacter sp. KACC 22063]|uniref:tetratricopeptide repeat-containing sensor histidine kinase n=1 Tax=Mucilaginibacter sp. KACC 22063 TaxID=3025666 RepID=UPI0023655AF0|nr:histidine kinase dimerization/phosphoacceptor domain -containing protein [Mucilaginibacter sp. KACC 22063]WDF56104.1 histidine kinase dimerization/phosphoacceptor domain -containing protein [Mucilaginibacter sp. KACC 22063]
MIRAPYYIILLLLCFLFNFCLAQKAPTIGELKIQLVQRKDDTLKVGLLVAAGRFYLTKPGELKQDMDSALFYNEQARKLSLKLNYNAGLSKSLILRSQIYREMGKKPEALALTKTALQFAIDHHLLKETADAWLALGDFLGIESADLAERIKYTEKAIPLYAKGNYKKEEADALKNLGDYYHLQADNAKALKLVEQSLAIYQSIHFKELQGAYDLLGYLHARTGNDVLALKYGLMAVRTAEQVRDTSMQLCTIYNRLAITYNNLKKTNEAYYYYQKALEVALRYQQEDAIQQIKFNQIILLLGTHKAQKSLQELIAVTHKYPPNTNTRLKITALSLFAKIYMEMHQLPEAKRYVDSLLFYYKDFGTEFGYAPFVNEPIIRYYFLSGQYQNAYPYLKTNDSLARIRHSLTTIATNELYWMRIDSATGKAVSALGHFQKYKYASDSIKDLDLKKQLSILQFQFDIDKKNRDIIVLQQNGQLQQNRIRNETILRNAVIGGLILLMIFSGLIYNRYSLKNKSNKLLTVKQAEINRQNNQLLKLVEEKEWLVKEIHHRVKNNLQIVISLLNTQSAYLDNEDALDAIKNSQHRMQTMSLIHQKLYQSDNLSTIDMAVYIRELVEYLSDSFGKSRNIKIDFEVSPIRLDVSQAVPLGLIMNEAISNSIKYAFKDVQSGRIDVLLQPAPEGSYLMCIADNGTGLPQDFDPYNTSSLGMSLMLGLTQQLDGELNLENNNGLKVCVTFKALEFNKLGTEIS